MGLMDRFKGKKAATEFIQYSVFIVSDDPVTSDLLQSTLQANGYSVSGAANGDEALRLLSQMELPHALIGNFTKSGTDAKEFITKAHIRFGKGILPPVLLLMDRPEDEDAAYAMHANDVLAKPFDNTRLLRSVSSMIAARVEQLHKVTNV